MDDYKELKADRLTPSITCIFDLDGTLFDSEQQISNAYIATCNHYGFQPSSPEIIRAKIGLPAMTLFEATSNPRLNRSEVVETFRKHLKSEIQRYNPVFPGVRELLAKLQENGVKLSVATNKPTDLAIHTIANSDISTFFSHIQGTTGFLPKPHPSTLRECLRINPGSSPFMFGDRIEDMEAANSANVVGIGLTHSGRTKEELLCAGAKFTFQSFLGRDEILKCIISGYSV